MVKFEWFNSGQEIQPIAYLDDVRQYEEAEAAAVKTGSLFGILAAKQAFLERVLANSSTAQVTVKLTVAQVQTAFKILWDASFERAEASPLEKS